VCIDVSLIFSSFKIKSVVGCSKQKQKNKLVVLLLNLEKIMSISSHLKRDSYLRTFFFGLNMFLIPIQLGNYNLSLIKFNRFFSPYKKIYM